MSGLPCDTYDVAVLGLGFAGSFTTEALINEKVGKVVAIDSNYCALGPTSSSRNECFRLHTGAHYLSCLETAKKCLRNSIIMADQFGGFVMDADDPNAPSRRGRHYLMSNSFIDIDEAKSVCEDLRGHYAELLEEFPSARATFGDPENFITYLSEDQYPDVAKGIPFTDESGHESQIDVVLCIETAECQIDIRKFSEYFNEKFAENEDLSTMYNHFIMGVERSKAFDGYVIKMNERDPKTGEFTQRIVKARSVINCTWQNVELIDKQLGFEPRTDFVNRLKVIARVDLPKEMEHINTSIFSVGPHGSVTRFIDEDGSKQAILTFEPVTNVGHFKVGTSINDIEDEDVKTLLTQPFGVETELGRQYGEDIIAGVSKYIPAFKDTKLRYVGMGFVKNQCSQDLLRGNDYIYQAGSTHNKRLFNGIEHRELGYVSFSGMKMSYTLNIAKEVVQIIQGDMSKLRAYPRAA